MQILVAVLLRRCFVISSASSSLSVHSFTTDLLKYVLLVYEIAVFRLRFLTGVFRNFFASLARILFFI